MGKSCCIVGCNVSSPKEYFKFPRSGSLLAAWVQATGAAGGDVCAAHFTAGDYKCVRGKRRLLGTAVPSVFEKPPSSIGNGEITSKNVKAKVKNKKAKQKKNLDKSKSTTDNKIEDSTDSKDVSDKTEEAIDESKENAEKNIEDMTEKANIENRESSNEVVDTRQAGGNGENGKTEKNAENTQTEVNDIEDMITNYQIKQTKTLADRLNPEPLEDLIPAIMAQEAKKSSDVVEPVQPTEIQDSPMAEPVGPKKVNVSQLASRLANKLDDQLAQIMAKAPVFIEVAVEQDETRAESPQDCLMLLESVQCDIDPSSLMLPEHGPDTDSDMEIVDLETKKEDPNPISLLTSSDEDEVIIEEPHIDTVEVSDETDEDDRPLQTLIRAAKPKSKPQKASNKKGNYKWGFEFYCVQCDYRTNCDAEFKQHNLELGHLHSTTINVCPTCNYTTASKAQFSRHKRKHRDERNFKCHLCNYKARHNMSLIYHLKCHVPVEKKRETFTCEKCGFSSNVKSEALSHLKLKSCDGKSCERGTKYSCDQCSYSTKRRSDLRRHRMRRHSVDDSDEDFTV